MRAHRPAHLSPVVPRASHKGTVRAHGLQSRFRVDDGCRAGQGCTSGGQVMLTLQYQASSAISQSQLLLAVERQQRCTGSAVL